MSGPVVVGRTDDADWRALKEVRLRALAADPLAFGSTLARELAYDDDLWRARAGQGRTFLARTGERVVGMAAFYAEDGREHERQLVGMWVAPGARSAGIGTRLVRAVRDAAAGEGACVLTLLVVDGNEPARRLYEGLGFRPTGEREPLGHTPGLQEVRYALALPSGG